MKLKAVTLAIMLAGGVSVANAANLYSFNLKMQVLKSENYP